MALRQPFVGPVIAPPAEGIGVTLIITFSGTPEQAFAVGITV